MERTVSGRRGEKGGDISWYAWDGEINMERRRLERDVSWLGADYLGISADLGSVVYCIWEG